MQPYNPDDITNQVAKMLEGGMAIPEDVSTGMIMMAIKAERDNNAKRHAEISQQNAEIMKRIEKIENNPFVWAGQLWIDHRKLATFILVAVFVIFNIWFVEPFREALLRTMGAPDEVVIWLGGGPTPVP